MASAVYQSIKSISGYIRQIVSGTKRRAPLGTMDVTVEVMTSVRKQCLAPRISKAWLEKELSKDVQRHLLRFNIRFSLVYVMLDLG